MGKGREANRLGHVLLQCATLSALPSRIIRQAGGTFGIVAARRPWLGLTPRPPLLLGLTPRPPLLQRVLTAGRRPVLRNEPWGEAKPGMLSPSLPKAPHSLPNQEGSFIEGEGRDWLPAPRDWPPQRPRQGAPSA